MNPITPHENEGRKFLFVGGLPVEARELQLGDLNYEDKSLSLHYDHARPCCIDIPIDEKSNWEDYSLLGTIHTEGNALVFSEGFDPEVLVEGNNGGIDDTMWRDYRLPASDFAVFHCKTTSESVLSLLESKGYTMLNIYGEKEPDEMVTDIDEYGIVWEFPNERWYNWRTSESKRHKFKVAVIEVNQ